MLKKIISKKLLKNVYTKYLQKKKIIWNPLDKFYKNQNNQLSKISIRMTVTCYESLTLT